jgi:hypothetical protein
MDEPCHPYCNTKHANVNKIKQTSTRAYKSLSTSNCQEVHLQNWDIWGEIISHVVINKCHRIQECLQKVKRD